MIIQCEKDIEGLRKIGRIVAVVREEMIKAVAPGVTTKEIDQIGESVLREYGAKSAPIHQYSFPGTSCISLNDEAAHGIPSDRVIREGDMVNIDVSAELDGYFADTGATVGVPPVPEIKNKLIDCSQTSLYKALEVIKSGVRTNQIGRAIETQAKSQGFTVIKNLTGHGIGRRLHEEPQNILNFYYPHDRSILKEGLVLAVETFISTGSEFVAQQKDGWTLKTPDKSLVAQFEHTIIVTKDYPVILTAL